MFFSKLVFLYIENYGFYPWFQKAVMIEKITPFYGYMYQTKDTDINKKERFVMSKNYIDNNSLAHIACKCKYHIYFL